MYTYVSKKKTKPYRENCQKTLTSLQKKLKKEYDIEMEWKLIGSGAENMVTRKGNGPFDLDYNIAFRVIPKEYNEQPGKLKDRIRKMLDGLVSKEFSRGKDSRLPITYSYRSGKIQFSFDIAITWQNKNQTYRLVHDKEQGRYIWNQILNMDAVSEKAEEIKKNQKCTNELRSTYLRLKNQYLEKKDQTHPSFIVYAEAVNEVYQQMKPKEEKEMSNNNAQNKSQYEAGKKKMFEIVKTLNRMSNRDRETYLNKKISYGYGYSMEDCIKAYSLEAIEEAVNQYLTDNLEIGEIVVRLEDNQEYLVVNYERNKPGQKTYRCVSLKEDKEFTLESIKEIKRTNKHLNTRYIRY